MIEKEKEKNRLNFCFIFNPLSTLDRSIILYEDMESYDKLLDTMVEKEAKRVYEENRDEHGILLMNAETLRFFYVLSLPSVLCCFILRYVLCIFNAYIIMVDHVNSMSS